MGGVLPTVRPAGVPAIRASPAPTTVVLELSCPPIGDVAQLEEAADLRCLPAEIYAEVVVEPPVVGFEEFF